MRKQREMIDGVLITDSPRYVDWEYVFDGDSIPLKSKAPFMSNGSEVFEIDVDRLRPIQFERLITVVTKVLGLKRTEVYKQIHSEGFNIRAADVKLAQVKRNFL